MPGVHILGACHILSVYHSAHARGQEPPRAVLAGHQAALPDEATALFAERGHAGTSLEDVASASQVTRGAVYHFASKQALFEAVLDLLEARVTAEVTAAASTADPWDAAMLALDTYLTHCCDPVYGRPVWLEGLAALGWHRWRECEKDYAYRLVERFIRDLADGGYLRDTAFDSWSGSPSGSSAAPGSPWPRRRPRTSPGCGTSGATSSARPSARCGSSNHHAGYRARVSGRSAYKLALRQAAADAKATVVRANTAAVSVPARLRPRRRANRFVWPTSAAPAAPRSCRPATPRRRREPICGWWPAPGRAPAST